MPHAVLSYIMVVTYYLVPLGIEKTIMIIVPILTIEEPKAHRRKYFTGRTKTNLKVTKTKPNPVSPVLRTLLTDLQG